MPDTWRYWSGIALGYIAEKTPKTERYVALFKIQYHLDQGYSERDVAQIWNTGRAGECIKGTNKYNVKYDSCEYERKVLAQL